MQAHAEELDPATAAAATRLIALTYASVLLPLAGALLPRDDFVIWPWLIVGLLAIAASAVMAAHQVYRFVSGHLEVRTPAHLMGTNLLCLVGVACAGYGLSGEFGLYRLMFLGPVLLMAVMGTRVMLALSCLTATALLVFTTAGSTTDLDVMPAFFVSYGAGLLLLALFVRTLSRVAFSAMRETDVFAHITAIVAGAADVFAALDELLPALHRYLKVNRATVFGVRNRLVDEHPLADWPVSAEPFGEGRLNDVRIAAVDGRVVIRENWTCLPIKGTDGIQQVLLLERREPKLLLRSAYEHDLGRIQVQLQLLITRLDLIASLEGLTRTDSLTELPNRRALSERLERELAVARRTRGALSVAMIDLDHFKQYNDSFGHVAGDDLLRLVARLLQERLRDTDFVARYGGEEFCAVLPYTTADDAATVFNEIHRRGRDLDPDRTITFSAGIAQWDGEEAIADLIDRADQALYTAKSSGRAQTQVARSVRPRPDQEVLVDPAG